ncbi:hypothetical protein ASG37_07065 [Sphingomonas sp. Leaf407]|uniref:hypothetical protein n=1 Tax=unclassified Sphingomonas TaxID=196159 RepID=UPI0006F7F2F3|nr:MULTISPECIES: hypothetical protein [unclassified Sphingomonas]KQN39336.1 hypothetical protein ASE97_04355 [Sphingomonas sp. Leaf42]KQT28612.1 hypothetical protein ASG37_07065 [Sphingomonas sp. Leaf407]
MTRTRRLVLSAIVSVAIAGAAGGAATHRPAIARWWQRMHLHHPGDALLDRRGHNFHHFAD